MFLLNSRLDIDEATELLNKDEHLIRRPSRLCYVAEKRKLVVGQMLRPSSVAVFGLGG